jgi:hypothetical protein
MSCSVCRNLTKKQLRKFAELYEDGRTPEDIGAQLSLSYDDAVEHATKCLKNDDVEEGKTDQLKDFLKSVKKLIQIAETQYEGQPDRSDLVHAFTALIGEARSIIDELSLVGNPAEVVRTVVRIALNPFIRKGVEVLTKEYARLRPELLAAGVKPAVLDSLGKQLLLGYAQNMKSMRSDVVERLAKALGVSKKDMTKLTSLDDKT